ncbi:MULTISPECIES: transglycosylase domain-containing protein [Brevibacterium]|uniref:Membrane carboxypeptidase (Penicillin-binding protein) n=1 Tax=Brevibacterium antiquum CNRZ 918 TaxID=1255637 RepID=A0A2H1I774_9MICO|nr:MULTISPECIES: transglycosylase domain-containing protein [Brevibacterium]SMX70974.1 Membrane carboxypeptidase (penicillin-binding protein) [Brevibacterium antiquum CNRZ 918]
MAKGQEQAKTRGKKTKNILNYPRTGVSGWTRFLPSVRLLVVGGLSIIIALCVLFSIGYAVTDVPEPNIEATGQTSTIYYNDGKTPIGQYKVEDRKSVPIDEISEPMRKAAIAAEDTSFYENRGISIKGLSRAVVGVVTNQYAGGGSTITQQYVKNFYLTNEHSLDRKVKEMFISLKIDQQQSKDEILANYLNTIYLGRRSYGIEVASQNYFDKPAKDLDVSESALLAAMIQRPGAADPADNPEAYQDRFDYVVKSMTDEGFITEEQAAKVKMPEVKKADKEASLKGQTGYMWDFVRREALNKLDIDEAQLDRGGYNITTTFDKDRMKAAEKAIKNLPSDQPEGLQAGLVSIDPDSGGIEAFYGGKNYLDQAFNASTQSHVQAGSTFKPFALVAGLENGVRLTDRYPGSATTFPNGGSPWPVTNFGGANYGPVTLLKATQSSINTAYAALNVQVGPDKTVDVAQRAGLSGNCTEEQLASGDTGQCSIDLTPDKSNVLGTPSVKPIDMANAYATFASNGVHHETHAIKKVTQGTDDEEVYKPETKGKRVFDKAVMAETSYALQQVVNSGSGAYAANLGRPAAGKTGTTDKNLAAWFTGYTPNLATSVVLYREVDNKPIPIGPYGGRGQVTGGSFPVQVWTEYMQQALEGTKVVQFPERGELPDKPKPKNTNAPAPPPQPKAPGGNNSGSDGDDSEKKAPIDKPSEKPKDDEDKDKDKGKDKDKEKEADGSEDSEDSDKGREDNGSSTDDDSGEGTDDESGGDGAGSGNEGGEEDDSPIDVPIKPPESPDTND